MKTKLLFLFLALFSLNAFADMSDDDNGQDGNGSDYLVTEYERHLCKYVQTEMKDSKQYTVIATWQGKTQELTKLDIETKCCEINPRKCTIKLEEDVGPYYAGEK
jgi:hypothetical protein